jgi:ABC-type phosphate/phosphonate transport system substrate-binding protein
MASINYVADHICRIEGIHAGHPDRILNSKWRIASNVDLFPYGTLAADGKLTPDQITQIDAYITKFKATPAGKEAIAFYARRAS